MQYANLFSPTGLNDTLQRINNLSPSTQAQWGKMSVDQMLAHCNVAYDMCYDESLPKAKGIKLWMLKLLVKNQVCGEKPYPKNGRTAPEFIITGKRDFEAEKAKLIDYMQKTQQHGETTFEGKQSVSLGKLTAKEWNTTFSKHLDHHLRQFGV